AIIPGDPDKSLLMKAVRRESEDLQMPPKKTLTQTEIAILAAWIKMGAPYSSKSGTTARSRHEKEITDEDRKWWAYQPVHQADAPVVQDKGWSRNPVDKFIF